jgi:DNA-binding GntR family transcriptional regulator
VQAVTYSRLVTVDHRDPTALYEQLAAILREQIAAGDFEETGMLPSESYLQQTHEVSRGTVRMAIAQLVAEGLVYKVKARGTYVRKS